MSCEDLELTTIAATEIIKQREVLIVGSQAILGSYGEDELPARATISNEVDIAPLNDDASETLAALIDGELGEWSDFDRDHGFYVRGVSVRTAYLPDRWEDRLLRIEPRGHPDSIGLCLEPHDLCAAKLARFDPKDCEFVEALIDARLVEAAAVRSRIDRIMDDRFEPERKRVASRWIKARGG